MHNADTLKFLKQYTCVKRPKSMIPLILQTEFERSNHQLKLEITQDNHCSHVINQIYQSVWQPSYWCRWMDVVAILVCLTSDYDEKTVRGRSPHRAHIVRAFKGTKRTNIHGKIHPPTIRKFLESLGSSVRLFAQIGFCISTSYLAMVHVDIIARTLYKCTDI